MLETIRFEENDNSIVVIDQTKLPVNVEYVKLTTLEEVWKAIKTLMVRGAPAIGVCAAFGIYMYAKRMEQEEKNSFMNKVYSAKQYLETSRPTAVNLFWALDEMMQTAVNAADATVEEVNTLVSEINEELKKEDDDADEDDDKDDEGYGNQDGDDSDDDTSQGGNNSNNGDSSNTNKPSSPQTGDVGILGFIGIGIASIAGVFANNRRKR